MSDSRAQFEALKAAASDRLSQLQNAATKKEALTSTIAIAEDLVKALKLAPPNEKKDVRTQCRKVFELADRIKGSETWDPTSIFQGKPEANTPSATSKHGEIGERAPDIMQPAAPSLPNPVADSSGLRGQTPSESASSFVDHLSGPITAQIPTEKSQVVSKNSTTPASSVDIVFAPAKQSGDTLNHLQNLPKPLVVGQSTRSAHQPDLNAPPIAASTSKPSTNIIVPRKTDSSTLSHTMENEHSPRPNASLPVSRVLRLREPIPTRKLSRKEEIILLKASIVNGFTCPPWNKNPNTAEFALDSRANSFTDIRDLDLSTYQLQFFGGWVRARDALLPPRKVSGDGEELGPVMISLQPLDLVQDAATDCSVVASLCAGIARSERGHNQLFSNTIWPCDKISRPVISPNGKYIVRLNFNGCWRRVVIDDRLPVSKTNRLLHVVDRNNPALLWPALLEKAYLKVRGGYDFPGSNSCSDLWALTGWVPEQIYLQEAETVPDQLWTRIYNAFQYGDVLVTVGTGKMSSRQEREFGLEGQHSYVILDMKETEDEKAFLVKNPWVEGKGWRGPRPLVAERDATPSTGSRNATGDSHRNSILSQETSTKFWIGLDHIVQHFESLYLNWNPGLFRHRQDIHFEWAISAAEVAGRCIVTHPQFCFWTKDSGVVWLLLSRHFRDSVFDNKDESDNFNNGSVRSETHMYSSSEPLKGYMSLYVCNGKGERLYVKESYLECGPFVNTPQTLLRWDTDANSTYTIVVDQEDLPASTYTFSLSAFSNSMMSLEPAVEKYAHQEIISGAWTKHTAGGGVGSPYYFDNPQYSLEVSENSSLALLLTSTTHTHPMHVKLAIGHGKRVYRLQSRDVIVDSGDHSGQCVFAETAKLQRGTYTVICSLFDQGRTGDYSLRVDSTGPVVLKPIPREGAGLFLNKLTPACFAAHVHKIAAPIMPNRLASYTIVARFKNATTPRSHNNLGMLARSPLRLSVEMGRGPERLFLNTSERGEYADSTVVRTDSFDIDPLLKMQGDLWIVLDRLSGTGGPVEEWYDVEILTDVPQAYAVGVWREWDD